MAIKKVLASILVGTTLITGTALMFNREALDTAKENIVTLAERISLFDSNEEKLEKKYIETVEKANAAKAQLEATIKELNEKLDKTEAEKAELEAKIVLLEKEIEELNKEIANLKAELDMVKSENDKLKEEVNHLTEQLQIANTEVEGLRDYSNKVVEYVNENFVPTNVDELPEFEYTSFTAKADFYNGHINLTIDTRADINLDIASNDNVKILFEDENGKGLKCKNKLWSGYLNDKYGNKYGKGVEWASNYSNDLKAGTYTTTLNSDDKLDVNNVHSIVVEITKDGKTETLRINR